MTTWRGKTEDSIFAVELEASVLGTLDRYCCDAGSFETGGILLGRYSEDRSVAIVSEATPPPMDSRRGHAWFVRGVHGLRDVLSQRWQARERTYYVGEWHFHPATHVEPSGEDFAQMLEIGRAKEYECREPLLLIFCARKHDGQRIFRAFVCPDGELPLEVISTCR
ncbi:MAG: Mov34/MPN/PAD-1 family protein [Myxococcota bacterium]